MFGRHRLTAGQQPEAEWEAAAAGGTTPVGATWVDSRWLSVSIAAVLGCQVAFIALWAALSITTTDWTDRVLVGVFTAGLVTVPLGFVEALLFGILLLDWRWLGGRLHQRSSTQT
jgi:hypothetical protein